MKRWMAAREASSLQSNTLICFQSTILNSIIDYRLRWSLFPLSPHTVIYCYAHINGQNQAYSFPYSQGLPSSASFAIRQSTSSAWSKCSLSNIPSNLPSHSCSMNSMASSLGTSMIFTSFPRFRSPKMVSLSTPSRTVTMMLVPLKLRMRIISTSFCRGVRSNRLAGSIYLENIRFRSRLLPSRMMRGQLAIFFITAFCFFHSSFSFPVSQSDFLSWRRLSSLAFSISIFCSCFFLKLELRLLFMRSRSPSAVLLFIVVVIFSRRRRFSLSISVNLSSSSICFLPLFRNRISSSLLVVLGRTFLMRYRCPSMWRSSSRLRMAFFPTDSGLYIQIY